MAEDAVEATPLATASGAEALSVLAHASMRCAGCGSKVGRTGTDTFYSRTYTHTHTYVHPLYLYMHHTHTSLNTS